VCLSRTASVGYVVVTTRPMATSQDFVNWICGDELEPEFLKYLFVAEGDNLLRFASGAVHQTIYFPEVKGFHVCVPERAEQRRIVAILDEAFEGIAVAKANAETNLRNAREIFEAHREQVLSGHGHDWSVAPLRDLCDIRHGYAFEGEYFAAAGKFVLLTPGNFHESGGYRDRGSKQKYFVGEFPADYVLSRGELLVAMTEQAAGLMGSPLLVPESERFLHNQRLGRIAPKPGSVWHNEFFFHVFNLRRVREEIHASASGVKVRHTSPGKMGDVCVAYPNSSEEQGRIASLLFEIEEECDRLAACVRRKIVALDELKQSLLHQAFTGAL
jgi:type I restriction enzyme S subunit